MKPIGALKTEHIARYQIKSELGRGGMATVYLAYDPNMDREVALKLLPREFHHHEEFRARFKREARLIAALEHTAIVPIYDFGEEEDQPYFIMRYMPGGSLVESIANGPMTIEESAKIIKRIGAALQYAHSKGIVHRDLKPGNILFDQFQSAYLCDFGIAQLQETGATLTGTVFMGTPAYSSPEQVHGDSEIDGRADIYALGVILYEMLTGEKPYMAATAAGTAIKHIIEPVPCILEKNPSLPPHMDQVINKAMAKNPEERYATTTDLTTDLATLMAGKIIAEEDTPAGESDASHVESPSTPIAMAAAAEAVDILVGTDTPEPPTTNAKPAPYRPTGKRSSRLVVFALIVSLIILCLVALAAAMFLFNGDIPGIFGDKTADTPTPTLAATPSATMTQTIVPTTTPTETLAPTVTLTSRPTETIEPTATNTAAVPPTLRPSNTPEPTYTPLPPTYTPSPIPPTNTAIPPTSPPSKPKSPPTVPPAGPTPPPP